MPQVHSIQFIVAPIPRILIYLAVHKITQSISLCTRLLNLAVQILLTLAVHTRLLYLHAKKNEEFNSLLYSELLLQYR